MSKTIKKKLGPNTNIYMARNEKDILKSMSSTVLRNLLKCGTELLLTDMVEFFFRFSIYFDCIKSLCVFNSLERNTLITSHYNK